MKKCVKCNLEKEDSCYFKNCKNKDKLSYSCKECCKEYGRLNHIKNRESHNKRNREYSAKNKEKMKIIRFNYFNSEEYKARKAEYDIEYRKNNKEKIAGYKKNWEYKNREKLQFKLVRNLRRRIHHVIKDNYKSDHTMTLLGCTIEEFIKHLENQFEEGMSWENYGLYGWHIDHIIPCCTFDLSKEEEQRKCFHFSNMQPLWAIDNLKKSKKLPNRDT